jgi:hypothetical protein
MLKPYIVDRRRNADFWEEWDDLHTMRGGSLVVVWCGDRWLWSEMAIVGLWSNGDRWLCFGLPNL